jgi:hypothetical protein
MSNGVAPFFVFSSWFWASSRASFAAFRWDSSWSCWAPLQLWRCWLVVDVTTPVWSLRDWDRVVDVVRPQASRAASAAERFARARSTAIWADFRSSGRAPAMRFSRRLLAALTEAWAAAMSSARVFGPPRPARACWSR